VVAARTTEARSELRNQLRVSSDCKPYRQTPKMIQLSATPTPEITAMTETVIPAAINPDSIPLVLFAKRMMELLMVSPPSIEEFSFFASSAELTPGHFDYVKSFVRENT
jgi:hypothetical protein